MPERLLRQSLNYEKGKIIYLPFQRNISIPDSVKKGIETLIDCLLTYLVKLRTDLPSWAHKPFFNEEIPVYQMIRDLNRQLTEENKKIALERIKTLFKEAKEVKDKKLANRYIKLARELSMKYKVKIPSNLKRRFCKHCKHYLVHSVNVRVRTRDGKVVYYCLDCKRYMRFPYLRERKAKRAKK